MYIHAKPDSNREGTIFFTVVCNKLFHTGQPSSEHLSHYGYNSVVSILITICIPGTEMHCGKVVRAFATGTEGLSSNAACARDL